MKKRKKIIYIILRKAVFFGVGGKVKRFSFYVDLIFKLYIIKSMWYMGVL